ncbi:MAG: hypothetical protein M3536_06700 [Actinomycetota bacterium]|nr:hypothetical protein [Actinomycetota bacterium]
MTTPRKPQDRKPKQDDSLFMFVADGSDHSLPSAATVTDKISARAVRDSLRSEQGEVNLMFALLDAVEGHDAARDALLDLPLSKMVAIAADWMKHSKGVGATLGE